jgi:hypothetical protein
MAVMLYPACRAARPLQVEQPAQTLSELMFYRWWHRAQLAPDPRNRERDQAVQHQGVE